MRKPLPVIASLAFVLTAGLAEPAQAHAFAQRYDLPLPLWLYLAGAGAVVALSFLLVVVFGTGRGRARTMPRLNLLQTAVGRRLTHPGIVFAVRLLSVALFLLTLAAGFFGAQQEPLENILPVMVWVVWWVGLAYISALVGDVWALINPWRSLAEGARALVRRAWPNLVFPPREPPAGIGAWPAVALFFLFAWAELVWPERSIPRDLATAVVIYSLITWAGMFYFGIEEWLRRGEAFTILFGLFARFAPTEFNVATPRLCAACGAPGCRGNRQASCVGCVECFRRATPAERQVNLRPYGIGLARTDGIDGSMVMFVLLALSTVSFDGFLDTPLWQTILHAIQSAPAIQALPAALGVANVDGMITTIGLFAVPLVFYAVYLLVCRLMLVFAADGAPSPPPTAMAAMFVLTLVPIAIAYHLAHFLFFFAFFGQFLIPLLSDPFGYGWDLFGTAGYRPDLVIVSARFVWFASVAAIVIGHVAAVYLAHFAAQQVFDNTRAIIRSQYPMLALMVGYTMVSLWILSQPIVAI